MEQRNEHPVFGRKVFFITPPLKFESYIVNGLRTMEYEVYVIHDYKKAKAVLKENKDALCFFYIDVGLTYEQWYKFIKTFELDEVLKTVFVGIISESIPSNRKNFFLINTKLPGGFIMANTSQESLLDQLVMVLDVNGAKGCRKYIRLDCTSNSRIYGYLAYGPKLFPIAIQDISTVGLAFNVTAELAPALQKNTVLNNISLTIDRSTFVLGGVVFNSVVKGNLCTVVVMLGNLKEREKQTIHSLIFETFDANLNNFLSTCLVDNTNYEELKLPEEMKAYGSLSDNDYQEIISELEAID